MKIEEIVTQCQELLDLMPAQALAKAREDYPDIGGFAVFPIYAPFEIIHAAGLMPIGMFGAGNTLEIMHADSRFQSFICSIAKSTLELFLRHDMDELEGAVFSSICDVARNLASLVERNSNYNLYIDYLHLPQNMANERSLAYTVSEFERFRTKLAKHLGQPIETEAIRKSLVLYNQVRDRIRKLFVYRQDNPGAISASEICAITRAGTRMMPETYLVMLDQVLELIKAREHHPRDSVKVVVEGAFCEQPPLELIDAIEAAGCEIKDDDMVVGWRLFPKDIPTEGDPVEAIASAYIFDSEYTSVRHDHKHPRTEGLIKRMKDSGAEAVIFAPAKFCEPALLDYVLFRQKLDEADIPHLKLEFEEKMWVFESPRTEVETFAESMLFD